jgi:hypothetical protein
MQFEDLRAVLRLPLKALGSPSGGNFLATSGLLAAISGCSVLFYRAGPEAFKYPYASEERFREALDYMPWDARAAGMQKGTGIKRLYGYARNPLAHAFGVSYHPGKATGQVPSELQWTLAIDKRRMSMKRVFQLEQAVDLPTFVGPPLRRTAEKTPTQPERLVLSVGGLYWGCIGCFTTSSLMRPRPCAPTTWLAGFLKHPPSSSCARNHVLDRLGPAPASDDCRSSTVAKYSRAGHVP